MKFGLPSHKSTGAEHISFCTSCRSHANICAFSGIKNERVLIEIPLPQVTEQDDHALQSEVSQPGVTMSSKMAGKKDIKLNKSFIFTTQTPKQKGS